MFFLKFIFLVLVVGLLVLIFAGLTFLRTINGVLKIFRKPKQKMQNNTPNNSYGDREGVVDHRNQDKANKKIFTKEEGEYIDFEEEK